MSTLQVLVDVNGHVGLTVTQAAEVAGVTPAEIRRLAREGMIESRRSRRRRPVKPRTIEILPAPDPDWELLMVLIEESVGRSPCGRRAFNPARLTD